MGARSRAKLVTAIITYQQKIDLGPYWFLNLPALNEPAAYLKSNRFSHIEEEKWRLCPK